MTSQTKIKNNISSEIRQLLQIQKHSNANKKIRYKPNPTKTKLHSKYTEILTSKNQKRERVTCPLSCDQNRAYKTS